MNNDAFSFYFFFLRVFLFECCIIFFFGKGFNHRFKIEYYFV